MTLLSRVMRERRRWGRPVNRLAAFQVQLPDGSWVDISHTIKDMTITNERGEKVWSSMTSSKRMSKRS